MAHYLFEANDAMGTQIGHLSTKAADTDRILADFRTHVIHLNTVIAELQAQLSAVCTDLNNLRRQ
jgi:septal ring factor EnvC (AmiA/AmiB activator)